MEFRPVKNVSHLSQTELVQEVTEGGLANQEAVVEQSDPSSPYDMTTNSRTVFRQL